MTKRLKQSLRKAGMHIETEGEFVLDLVCGMEIHRTKVKHASVYGDKVYQFCSRNCKKHFDENPEKYTVN